MNAIEWVAWCLLAMAVAHGLFAAGAVLGWLAGSVWARTRDEREMEDEEAVTGPRLRLPVSVIAVQPPGYPVKAEALASLRALAHFPTEIIVVAAPDSAPERAVLLAEFAPEPCRRFLKNPARSESIQEIRRSRDHRLVFVTAATSDRADAFNCGLGLARHAYVCCVDADAVYRPDALTRALAEASRSPETVAAVLGCLTPELAGGSAFRHIDEARARLSDRICFGRHPTLPCRDGTFALWRRDVIESDGGFRSRASDPILDMTARARTLGRVLMVSGSLGSRRGHASFEVAATERMNWRGAARRELDRQRQRPVFSRIDTLIETTGPVFETSGILALAVLAATGALRPEAAAGALGLLVFPPAVLSVLALLFQDLQQRLHGWAKLAWLTALTPVETLVHRPCLAMELLGAAIRPRTATPR